MTAKLDIEGIRERVKKDSVQIILDPEVAPVPPDGVVYFDFTVNLLTEIDRLNGELTPLRKIYNAVNLMLNELGAYGEITTMHDTVSDLMDELHDFDGGVYTRIDLEQAK